MFFQVDDKLHVNLKVTRMIETEGVKRAGPAVMLWTLAGSRAQDAGSDGVTTEGDIVRLTLDRREGMKAAQMLVQYGLWHAPGHECVKCPDVEPGSFVFHDWFQFGYDTGEQAKVSTAKRKELKDEGLRNAVWARDSISPGVALCRYCGHKVSRGDRKSDRRPHLDHVDPTQAIGATNIVIACEKCNQRKYNKTLEQAGMILLPPPGADKNDAEDDPPADKNDAENNPRTARDRNPRPGLSSKIRSDPRSDQIPESVPHGRAREGARGVGSGRGGVGSGSRRGAGRVRQGVGAPPGRPPPGLAGDVPDQPSPGRWGSPWKGWSGPPPSDRVMAESTCPSHGMPEPCRKCPVADDVEVPAASRGAAP